MVGIPAATAGTIFLAVRVWDGFADIFAGRLVDRTNTRWGRFRPYILFGSLPLLLLNVAVFTRAGPRRHGASRLRRVSYAIFGLAYSVVNIPYGSLATAMTQDPTERSKLSSVRVLGSNATILLLAVAVAPQIEGSGDLQQSLAITTIV